MNKKELVNQVAERAGVTKANAEAAVNTVFETIAEALQKGRDATFVGFGTFSVAKRAAREGRNPQTGAAIRIPASRVPKFRPGKALKDAVN